jgi:hypothetical protein
MACPDALGPAAEVRGRGDAGGVVTAGAIAATGGVRVGTIGGSICAGAAGTGDGIEAG